MTKSNHVAQEIILVTSWFMGQFLALDYSSLKKQTAMITYQLARKLSPMHIPQGLKNRK